MDGSRDRTGFRFDADWTDTVALDDWRPSPRAPVNRPASWAQLLRLGAAGPLWRLGPPLMALLLVVGWNATGFWAYELLALVTLGLALRLLTGRLRLSLWLLAWVALTLAYAGHLHMRYLGRALTYHALADLPTAASVALDFAGLEVAAALLALVLILATGLREPRRPLPSALRALFALACAGGVAALVWIAATQPVPPWAYSGGYGRGRAIARLLIGSAFDLAGLPTPAAEGRVSYCCMRHSDAALRPVARPAAPAHLVIVLLESSFEARHTLGPDAPATPPLPHALPLQVHTVGGSTWRSEYAVLHGVPDPVYGPAGAYVQLLGPGHLDGALPRILAAAGYASATVSTTDPAYYGSARMHRSLGMAAFLSCSDEPACRHLERADVPDSWAYQRVLRWLDGLPAARPGFSFATTIRQHSPHVPEYELPGPATAAQALAEFSRRQALSMAEWQAFVTALARRPDHTVVIAFGDHIPADVQRLVPARQLIHPELTHFTVFDSRAGYVTERLAESLGLRGPLDIAHLDVLALQALGLETVYSQDKRRMLREQGGAYRLEVP